LNPCRDQIWGRKFDEAATKAGVATPDATSAPFENMSSAATAIAEADLGTGARLLKRAESATQAAAL